MSTPEFILELRERIDHMPLWLIGVTGYVRRDDGLILLEQRADNGKWTLVTGINEPGEEPADTVVREAKEETGVDVIVTDLVSVKSDHEIKTYRNGDQTWYMDHLFLCDEDIDDVYYDVKPYLVSGDISGAVGKTVDGMGKLVDKAKGFHTVKKVLISLIIGLAVGGITVLVMKSKLNSVGRQSGAANYVIPGSFILNESRDLFLYSNVTRTARSTETRSGGGGGHISSSGVSHGGGTR